MKQLLLAGLLLFTTLSAENFFTTNEKNSADITISTDINSSADLNTSNVDTTISEEKIIDDQKVIYLNYEEIPTRVLKGEIFEITIKALSTTTEFTDIVYDLAESQGLKLLSVYPSRQIDDRYYYETFHFLTTSTNAKLPNITATLLNNNNVQYRQTVLYGKKLNVVTLNPKKDFSNIVAESFELVDYKTTSYDDRYNIIIFVAMATNCDISALELNNVYKQGIESITESYEDSKITYYAIVDKQLENLSFTYFNLYDNKFELIEIPIIVCDDSVTTQSDLKPKDQSRERLKMSVAAIIALLGLLIILWRKKYIYLIFIILPVAYIAYIGSPSKEICIKLGSKIQLLPVTNGTIFETTQEIYHLQKEGKVKNWTKVQLENHKIGWVSDKDICSY